MRSRIRSDFSGLDNLMKSVRDERVTRVGVFSGKTVRNSKSNLGETNAGIGAVHEFGSISANIAPRSWLRMPIHRERDKIAEEAMKVAPSMARRGDMTSVLKAVGVAAENAVQRAFASGGFGLWRKLKAATIARKKSSAILIDKAQLRRSVSSEVGARR